MIVGSWHVYLPAAGGLACPVSIAANGAVAAGNCVVSPGMGITILHPPAGTLTIDRSCHVTGSIAFDVCIGDCTNHDYSVQIMPSLWRSGDGTRLSGTGLIACTGDCSGSFINPLELVAGQQ
jgi:hypothetical protein